MGNMYDEQYFLDDLYILHEFIMILESKPSK